MYCKKCGKELKPNAKFCASCGAKVEAQTEAPVQKAPVPSAEPKSEKGKIAVIIAIAVTIIIAIIVATVVALSNRSQDEPKSTSESKVETVSESEDKKDDEHIDEDEDKDSAEDAESGNEEATTDEEVSEDASSSVLIGEHDAFYGIWVAGFKTEAEAIEVATRLMDLKFYDTRILLTTEWENLNPQPYYVVTSGAYLTKEEADANLELVKSFGYPSAYVKFTGNYKG